MKEKEKGMRNTYAVESAIERFDTEAEKILNERGCLFTKESGPMGAVYTFDDGEAFREICMRSMMFFYKLRDFRKFIHTEETIADCAFLGALMSMEEHTERAEIERKIGESKYLNLDGFYAFKVPELSKARETLAKLMGKLFDACESDRDKIALILYIMNLQGKKGKRVKVFPEELEIDGERKPIVDCFDDRDRNIIFNLFWYFPDLIEFDPSVALHAETRVFLHSLSEEVEAD